MIGTNNRKLRYAAFDPKTGRTLARGKRLGDIQGAGNRFLVDWKKERYAQEGYYPVARPDWIELGTEHFTNALDTFAESAKQARRQGAK